MTIITTGSLTGGRGDFAMQGELEVCQHEVGTLTGRLGDCQDLQNQLEKSERLIQDKNTELKVAYEETQHWKRSREEISANLAEKETELLAVKAANAVLVAEIQERHSFAETIRNNWRVLKATVESFQCEEVKPLDLEALVSVAPDGDCAMGEGAGTDSRAQESSDHSETLSRRVSDQGEEEISGGEEDAPEAIPNGEVVNKDRAEGSTPANRPMVSMEERRCQLMRAIKRVAKVAHSRIITRKRVMAVLHEDASYQGWMHDDKWDNGRTAYECKQRGLIENLGKGKWRVTRAGMRYHGGEGSSPLD
ncbi:hypothetical protein CVIRNUC_003251 [Coccomyxa viridis]|uniref:Uncharacterized protein n=1 Tax=Coccomyxa viridis TaxID=1274662 RepID=A0AAV1HY43_9CHLO|nr:hypothetical protein CVIRNUC_003251 [Coccomyxa viridis]